MPLILAIVADPQQAAQLASLVQGRLSVDLVQAAEVGEGLLALNDRIPDLILTSPLMNPFDDGVLDEYLRELGPAGAHVQTLRIPVLSQAPKKTARLGFSLRRRTKAVSTLEGCDPKVFADEIAQYLSRAAEDKRNAAPPPVAPESIFRPEEEERPEEAPVTESWVQTEHVDTFMPQYEPSYVPGDAGSWARHEPGAFARAETDSIVRDEPERVDTIIRNEPSTIVREEPQPFDVSACAEPGSIMRDEPERVDTIVRNEPSTIVREEPPPAEASAHGDVETIVWVEPEDEDGHAFTYADEDTSVRDDPEQADTVVRGEPRTVLREPEPADASVHGDVETIVWVEPEDVDTFVPNQEADVPSWQADSAAQSKADEPDSPTIARAEPAKGSALDIPAEPSAGRQYLLARSARLGPPCGAQRVQNSRNEAHSGPTVPDVPIEQGVAHVAPAPCADAQPDQLLIVTRSTGRGQPDEPDEESLVPLAPMARSEEHDADRYDAAAPSGEAKAEAHGDANGLESREHTAPFRNQDGPVNQERTEYDRFGADEESLVPLAPMAEEEITAAVSPAEPIERAASDTGGAALDDVEAVSADDGSAPRRGAADLAAHEPAASIAQPEPRREPAPEVPKTTASFRAALAAIKAAWGQTSAPKSRPPLVNLQTPRPVEPKPAAVEPPEPAPQADSREDEGTTLAVDATAGLEVDLTGVVELLDDDLAELAPKPTAAQQTQGAGPGGGEHTSEAEPVEVYEISVAPDLRELESQLITPPQPMSAASPPASPAVESGDDEPRKAGERPRQDSQRRRGAKSSKRQAKAASSKPQRPRTEDVQDEWGIFDPDQCGFAALVDKLDEVAEKKKDKDPPRGTKVRVISYG